jgi:hypothetical protein
VCCGTKRLVEISCPSDCVYLTTAKSHPPAVEQRRLEQDRAILLPVVQGLSDRQARVFLMFAATIGRHESDGFQKMVDEDIAMAAAALAATLETSVRGIVYEHRAATVSAERLLVDLKAVVAELTKEGGTALERDAAIALRRIEAGAAAFVKLSPGGVAFQQLLVRLLAPSATAPPEESEQAEPASPSIIIP